MHRSKVDHKKQRFRIFEVLPKFILRRVKRLLPWWLVGTPYASESDLVRWWWWCFLWSFHILRNLIKVNGNVVVAPSNEFFCVENEPYAVAKKSAQAVEIQVEMRE